MCCGFAICALEPDPSVNPQLFGFAPAIVVTTPAVVTLRIAQFVLSATYRFPSAASYAIPYMLPNFALVPVPSANPQLFGLAPARVVTTPAVVTLRTAQ